MNNFDDIPIKEFNKKNEEYGHLPTQEDEHEEESNMNLIDMVEHPKWKIRIKAY